MVTKIDQVDQDQLNDTTMSVSSLIKEVSQKISIIVRNEENVVLLSKQIQEEDICPVFLVSNTTG